LRSGYDSRPPNGGRIERALFWLSDEARAAIDSHLLHNHSGGRRPNDCRVISGIIHMLRCGARWKNVPAAYGSSTTLYDRWKRWSRRGIWRRLLAALAEPMAIGHLDSNYIKAHRSAQGGGGQGTRHRRLSRWPATKVHALCDRPPRAPNPADVDVRQHLGHPRR
jgi:transposase